MKVQGMNVTYIQLGEYVKDMQKASDKYKGVVLDLVGLLTGYVEDLPSVIESLRYPKGAKVGVLELIGVRTYIGEEVTEYWCKGKVPVVMDIVMQDKLNKKRSENKLGLGVVVDKVVATMGTGVKFVTEGEESLVLGFQRYNYNNEWCGKLSNIRLIDNQKDKLFFDRMLYTLRGKNRLHYEVEKELKEFKYKEVGVNLLNREGELLDIKTKTVNDVGGGLTRALECLDLGVEEGIETSIYIDEPIRDSESLEVVKRYLEEKEYIVEEIRERLKETELESNEKENILKEYILNVKELGVEGVSLYCICVVLGREKSSTKEEIKRYKRDIKELLSLYGADLIIKMDEMTEEESGKYYTTLSMLRDNKELGYIGVIDTLLNLQGRLVRLLVENRLEGGGLAIINTLKTNPYLLGYVSPELLGICDYDKIRRMYNIEWTEELEDTRLGLMGHLYLLNRNIPGVGTKSAIRAGVLYYNLKQDVKEFLSEEELVNIQTTGYLYEGKVLKHISKYISKGSIERYRVEEDIEETLYYLNTEGGVTTGKGLGRIEEGKDIVRVYCSKGLGVKYNNIGTQDVYITDYMLLKKELEIYECLKSKVGVYVEGVLTREEEEVIIEGFERRKSEELGVEFKLEDKQKQVLKLINYNSGCLTGCAGSGKTTTVELLLDGLEYKGARCIVCVAPTGKASARLRESIKRPTRTIHSYFKIGMESDSIYSIGEVEKLEDIDVVIIDEASMVTLHVMYDVIRKLPESTKVYLIGDKEQLFPVGVGKVFEDSLGYLPRVVLDVTKRAKEGSKITKNAENILNMRDVVELEQGEEFEVKELQDSKEIQCEILRIVRGYKEGVLKVKGEEVGLMDIQVISPYKTKKGIGTQDINKLLQELYTRRKGGVRYEQKGEGEEVYTREIRIGDKVINTENNTLKERYELNGKFLLDREYQQGVTNGDVGIVVGKEEGEKEGEYNLLVQYSDVSVSGGDVEDYEYIVKYRYKSKDELGVRVQSIKEKSELDNLELAYALTVHKVQGSQAKVIIFVLKGTTRLITRNIIYTGITRATDKCYMLGDIGVKNSVLEGGLKVKQTDRVMTVLSTTK